MEVLKRILKAIKFAFRIVFVRLRYNHKTIAAYYRKQGATIGENCMFDNYSLDYSLSAEPFLINIGDHVQIAEGALLHTHDGGAWIARQENPDVQVMGKIIIEDNCLIGVRAQISPNVRIGQNSIVGAGSVVISDVPANSIVMGVPARVIGSSIKYKEKCMAIWNDQKPPGYENMNPSRKKKALKKHLLEIFKD